MEKIFNSKSDIVLIKKLLSCVLKKKSPEFPPETVLSSSIYYRLDNKSNDYIKLLII